MPGIKHADQQGQAGLGKKRQSKKPQSIDSQDRIFPIKIDTWQNSSPQSIILLDWQFTHFIS